MLPEAESSAITDTGLTNVPDHGEPKFTFPSASSFKVGEVYQSSEDKTAIKMADITIHVYQVQGETDMGYSVVMHVADIFDKDRDAAKVLAKIAENLEKRYRNRKNKSQGRI